MVTWPSHVLQNRWTSLLPELVETLSHESHSRSLTANTVGIELYTIAARQVSRSTFLITVLFLASLDCPNDTGVAMHSFDLSERLFTTLFPPLCILTLLALRCVALLGFYRLKFSSSENPPQSCFLSARWTHDTKRHRALCLFCLRILYKRFVSLELVCVVFACVVLLGDSLRSHCTGCIHTVALIRRLHKLIEFPHAWNWNCLPCCGRLLTLARRFLFCRYIEIFYTCHCQPCAFSNIQTSD